MRSPGVRVNPSSVVVLALGLALAACGDNSERGGPRAAFELPRGDGSIALANIPFPNDVLIDDDGELEVPVEAMPFAPGADEDVLANASATFAELDCYGANAGVIFPLAGLEEGDSAVAGSLGPDTVLLVDLATGKRFPTEHHVRAREQQVFVRARRGTVLAGGATYGALLTRGVMLESGGTLGASRDLEDALGGKGRAARAYAPLAAYLAAPEAEVAAADVAGAAVFTTCDHDVALEAIVLQLDEADPAAVTVAGTWRAGAELDGLLGTPVDDTFPGVDNEGGIAHADIGFLVTGTFAAPNYQSATPSTLGAWELDGDGAPVVKGMDDVPFLLALPAGLDSYSEVPVVVFQHGLGGTKNDVLALANSMAAAGMASISIDIPFHGARYPGSNDDQHNYGDGEGADGLVDSTGPLPGTTFFDLLGGDGVDALDPRVQVASFRQAAVDVMSLARLLDGGDWSAIGGEVAALEGLGFRGDRIVYASESFGGLIGTLALAFEPRYQAAFLAVAGGGLVSDLLENSPQYSGIFMPILGGAYDVSPNEVDPMYDPAHTHWAYQFLGLLLGAADPLTYARRIPEKGVHVVLAAAYSDESVPNQSGEALAAALGLEWVRVPNAVDGPRYIEDLPVTDLPLEGNVTVGDHVLTAGFFELDPASHGMLTRGRGYRAYEIGFPPMIALPEDDTFDNPILQLHAYLRSFATSFLATATPRVDTEAP